MPLTRLIALLAFVMLAAAITVWAAFALSGGAAISRWVLIAGLATVALIVRLISSHRI